MKMGRIRAESDARPDGAGADSPTKARSRARSRRKSLTAHRAFAPLIGLWGAALAGLSVLVLPVSMTARLAMFAGLSALGPIAHFVIAALAAIAGAAVAFGIARAISRIARRGRTGASVATMARMRPLRPVEDLGSASFDAPIEEMPFGMKAEDWADRHAAEETANEGDSPTAASATIRPSSIRQRLAFTIEEVEASAAFAAPVDPVEPVTLAPPPELDLADFAQLPGRNAVWVEGPLPAELPGQAESAAATPGSPARDISTGIPREARPKPRSATELLRETPAQDLSLLAMVERLAAALHERQSAETGRGPGDILGDGRDAVLAEALKALAVLAEGDGGESDGKSHAARASHNDAADLRAALAKLHNLRGAA